MGYLLIFVVLMAASFIVQRTLTSRIEKYSKTPLSSGLSGKEVAEKMLRDNGIYDVQVTCTGGFLTDHYDPTKKTVNLSQGVFEGRNIASAAVAAHECGHAVQHATAYQWLTMRSKLVPATQIGSQLSQWVLLAGIILMSLNMLGIGRWVLLVGIGFFALTTLFSIITLPVEYNAGQQRHHDRQRDGHGQGRPQVGRPHLPHRRPLLAGHAVVLLVHFPG